MDSIDKRFSKIGADPKFKRVPKSERKIKIDKRFQSIFNDERFKVKYTIDKRGRPLHSSTTEDFKKFYHMSDDESCNDTNSEKNSDDDIDQKSDDGSEEKSDEQTLIEKKNAVKRNKVKKNIKDHLKDKTVDYARGDCELMSDSSSDDDTSSDEEKEGKYLYQ